MSGFAQDVEQVYPLSPGKVYTGSYPGVNLLGHTDENGTKVTVKSKEVMTKVAKYGESATNKFLNGQQVEVEFTVMQTDMTIISTAFAGWTLVTSSAGLQKLTLGVTAGTKVPVVTLTIVPELTQGTEGPEYPTTNFTCLAVPSGDWEAVYEGKDWKGYKCKFTGIVNEGGAADGSWNGTFGDATVTASGTLPTVSAVDPANDATGVSTSTTVAATITVPLNPFSIFDVPGQPTESAKVLLLEVPSSGALVNVPATVALVNDGSSTSVTLMPNSAITASKTYVFVMSGSITDQNGNRLGAGLGFQSTFAT